MASARTFSGRPSSTTRSCSTSGLPRLDGLTVLRRWRDAGLAMPVHHPDRAGQLAREGAGHRRRRRRLHGEAVPDGGAARAAARRDPPGGGTGVARAARRRRVSRSAPVEGHARRRAGEADQPRVPRAVVSDAPLRPRRLTGRVDRAHLLADVRSRFEHGRSLHRAAAAQARRVVHRNGARARLPRLERTRDGVFVAPLAVHRRRAHLGRRLAPPRASRVRRDRHRPPGVLRRAPHDPAVLRRPSC